MRLEQEALVTEDYHACCHSGHELLLEVILPESHPDQCQAYYGQILQRFYQLGIQPDWLKLPPLSPRHWREIGEVIDRHDRYCRGVVILGLDASEDHLKAGFAAAADARFVKGFAVGRTIFAESSAQWFRGELDDGQLIEAVKMNFTKLIGYWRIYRPARR